MSATRPLGLLETQETMHRLLRGELTPEAAAAILGAPVERLAAYQGFVAHHIEGILEKIYTVLPQLMEAADWRALRDRYFSEVPATDFEMNANAAAFPQWLEGLIEADEVDLREVHVELCQLEWSEFAAYADEAVLPAPETLARPVLNPTLRILDLSHPVSAFLEAWRDSCERSRPALPRHPAPEVVFVFRDPRTLNHHFQAASDPLLFAFKVVHDQLGVAEAATQAGADEATVQRVLEQAAEVGIVLLPSREAPTTKEDVG